MFNPFAGALNDAGSALRKKQVNEALVSAVKKTPPPMGGAETAAPRLDPEAGNAWANTPQSLRGGFTPFESKQEADFVGERGMIRQNDFSWKDRLKHAGMNALIGGLQGGAATGTWQGAVSGAGAGGAVGAIDPRLATRMQYEMQQPQMEREADMDLRRQQAQAALKGQEAQQNRADAGLRLDQNRDARDQERHDAIMRSIDYSGATGADPKRYIVGGDLVDPYGRLVYRGRDKEKAESPLSMDEAEAVRMALEGSVDRITDDSMKGREAALRAQLPKVYRDALDNPNGVDAETYDKARRAWADIQSGERKKVRDYTDAEAKRKNLNRRYGMTDGRPLGDVMNKYPILRQKFGGR